MLKRCFAALLFCASLAGIAAPTARQRPKLVLAIVVDQFRYDYLTRFRGDYNAGLDRLLKDGAVFTHANLIHFPSVTAVGHSTILTGAMPSCSGIVANEWYDRATGKTVTSVSDDGTRLLAAGGRSGSSPRRLMVDTVGDGMKMTWDGKARVIGISLKDRGAILIAGHKADAAYWLDTETGAFTSSTYYFPKPPAWVAEFDNEKPADRFAGAQWRPLAPGVDSFTRKMPEAAGRALYNAIDASPYGNELLEAFAERAFEAEQLGRHEGTDLLAISFSSNDYVGHQVGPDAPEVRDMSIRTDRLLGKLFQLVDARVGLQNVLVVLTADHGVAPMPETRAAQKLGGGRISETDIEAAAQDAIAKRFGPGKWIAGDFDGAIYLNRGLIHEKHLEQRAVEQAAAEALRRVPHVFRVYTRGQILKGKLEGDLASRLVKNGFNVQRSADVTVLYEPYWIDAPKIAVHGSVNDYDTHIPIIFMGPEIKPGTYDQPIAQNDIAPTLTFILGIRKPDGSVGRVLKEIVK